MLITVCLVAFRQNVVKDDLVAKKYRRKTKISQKQGEKKED